MKTATAATEEGVNNPAEGIVFSRKKIASGRNPRPMRETTAQKHRRGLKHNREKRRKSLKNLQTHRQRSLSSREQRNVIEAGRRQDGSNTGGEREIGVRPGVLLKADQG